MILGLAQKIQHLKFLVNNNSTTILTGMGVAGTVSTAYLSGRASFKAARIINDIEDLREEHRNENGPDDENMPVTRTEKVRLVWRLYIPPVTAAAATIASIVVANNIASKKIAALTVASGISERALQEYKDKVVEKLGERQNQKIRDEVAQDRITRNPVNSEIILVGTGEVLCYDMTTGRYFQSTVENIKRAENKINSELLHHMSASLAEFHEEVGLPSTAYTDSVGWSGDEMFKVVFSTVMSPDDRPCIAIDFERPPVMEYARFYN